MEQSSEKDLLRAKLATSRLKTDEDLLHIVNYGDEKMAVDLMMCYLSCEENLAIILVSAVECYIDGKFLFVDMFVAPN